MNYISIFIYLSLTACNGMARWYVQRVSEYTVPEIIYLYGHIGCFLPYIAYKFSFKSKWFLYIFVQFFALAYVYIFNSKNVVYFFASLVSFSDILLRYHLYWKYQVYSTITERDAENFQIYASASYIGYHINNQIGDLLTRLNIDTTLIVYICSVLYITIGVVVYIWYVEEKHILMNDNVNTKRAILNVYNTFFSNSIFFSFLNRYKNIHILNLATIIGSALIITLNGKILEYFSNIQLRYLPSIIFMITLLCMNYIETYANYVKYAGLSMILACKYIMNDILHQKLHITHKKNVIDCYIGLEIIAISLSIVTLYFIPNLFLMYYAMCCCIFLFVGEYFTKKYYIKDQEFLECIAQLNEF